MSARELKHKALLEEWRERITVCRSSGQTVSRWCREEGIAPKTYYRWEREVLNLAGEQLAVRSGSESPAFVEVRAAAETGGMRGLGRQAVARLHMAAGELEVYSGADQGTLRAIIGALKDAE